MHNWWSIVLLWRGIVLLWWGIVFLWWSMILLNRWFWVISLMKHSLNCGSWLIAWNKLLHLFFCVDLSHQESFKVHSFPVMSLIDFLLFIRRKVIVSCIFFFNILHDKQGLHVMGNFLMKKFIMIAIKFRFILLGIPR